MSFLHNFPQIDPGAHAPLLDANPSGQQYINLRTRIAFRGEADNKIISFFKLDPKNDHLKNNRQLDV